MAEHFIIPMSLQDLLPQLVTRHQQLILRVAQGQHAQGHARFPSYTPITGVRALQTFRLAMDIDPI